MADLFKNWNGMIVPLLKLYCGRKHPLSYGNRYQLLVMVMLSAQDSDSHINALSPGFFAVYPSMEELARASEQELILYIGSVRNCENKAKWLVFLSREIGSDQKIPHTLADLIALPGIGRKSANVIIRESGDDAEGIIVDLHVVRTAPRLGIAHGKTPEKIEKEIMDEIAQENWNDAGMALSFLGREVCRPQNPKCGLCVMKDNCEWYASQKS